MTESKWKEERKRRIKTEKRLRLAEDSLKRLDRVRGGEGKGGKEGSKLGG